MDAEISFVSPSINEIASVNRRTFAIEGCCLPRNDEPRLCFVIARPLMMLLCEQDAERQKQSICM